MEDQYDGLTEEQLWEVAEVDGVVRDAIGSVLQDVQFQASKVDSWAGNVVEGCLKRPAGAGKPFKYIVTCNLAQKVGAGLHTASSQRWAPMTDGKLTVQWENNSTSCICTVYWLAA